MIDPRQAPEQLQHLAGALTDDGQAGSELPGMRRPRGGRRAAVLIALGEERLDLTFTERPAHMRKHPGQISFPGGSLDPGETAVEAALREAREEIALDTTGVRVMGRLPNAHVPASGFDVAAIVALWDGTSPIRPASVNEVAAIHRYPLADLADPANRFTAKLPTGYRGPAFVFDDIFVWGFTAHLVDRLLELSGLAVPWRTEAELEVPWRFLREGKGPDTPVDDP